MTTNPNRRHLRLQIHIDFVGIVPKNGDSPLLELMQMNRLTPVSQKKQKGASMIEYAVVVTLVVLAAVLTLTNVGTNLSAKFTSIANSIK